MKALSSSDGPTMKEQAAVQAFLQRLHRDHSQALRRTVLFGSKARGDSEPDSDIDILIVVDEESWTLRDAISAIAAQVSLEYGVLIGPRVIGQERWARMERERFSFYENVAREGIPLTVEPA
ncbi:MAG: nucleotidyltransferase domain-containing protein [Chloroflexota bacterium]